MRLLFRQRAFSWLDSYDIYDESGDTAFTVRGQLSWGHCLHVEDRAGRHIATLQERVLSFLPQFDLYIGDDCVGRIRRELSLFTPRYSIDCSGWDIRGDFMGWDYEIVSDSGRPVAQIQKQLLNWTDTYVLEILDPRDALLTLLMVLAIDADKCSHENG